MVVAARSLACRFRFDSIGASLVYERRLRSRDTSLPHLAFMTLVSYPILFYPLYPTLPLPVPSCPVPPSPLSVLPPHVSVPSLLSPSVPSLLRLSLAKDRRTASAGHAIPSYLTIPSHSIPSLPIQFHAIPSHTIYHTIPYHTIPYHVRYNPIPYHTIPYTIPSHPAPLFVPTPL